MQLRKSKMWGKNFGCTSPPSSFVSLPLMVGFNRKDNNRHFDSATREIKWKGVQIMRAGDTIAKKLFRSQQQKPNVLECNITPHTVNTTSGGCLPLWEVSRGCTMNRRIVWLIILPPRCTFLSQIMVNLRSASRGDWPVVFTRTCWRIPWLQSRLAVRGDISKTLTWGQWWLAAERRLSLSCRLSYYDAPGVLLSFLCIVTNSHRLERILLTWLSSR